MFHPQFFINNSSNTQTNKTEENKAIADKKVPQLEGGFRSKIKRIII